MARYLGIDYGERRIGLALSDPTGVIASPLITLQRRQGKRPPYAELERLVRQYEVEGLVVGLPLDLSGEETPWTTEVREFGDKLAGRTALPVSYFDERMTSVMAERAIRSMGLPRNKREQKERVDTAAASILLQNFLESTRSSG